MIGKRPTSFLQSGADVQFTAPVIGTAPSKLGTPTYDTGKFGDGIDGTNNATWNWNPTNYWSDDLTGTISMWYSPKSGFDAGTNNWLAHFSNSGYLIYFYSGSTGFVFRINMNGTTIVHYQPAHNTFTVGTWYHIAMCWDRSGIDGSANTMRFYKDGTQVDSSNTSWTSSAWPSANGGYAAGTNGTQPLIGLLDNIALYDYAKTNFRDRHFNTSQILR